MTYVAPDRTAKAFTCPHCGVLARSYKWGYKNQRNVGALPEEHDYFCDVEVSLGQCEHCGDLCIWHKEQLVYPNRGSAPLPPPDMPPAVKADYEEAAKIATMSPRGAAALLRLAIQKLCVHLGGSGSNLNDDIGILVSKGLPVTMQQALDSVRVIGNNAVHPGQIDANDAELAGKLFPLVNLLVEYMISMPARVGELYASLPDGAKNAVEKRDAKK
jgi:hypothetical protein